MSPVRPNQLYADFPPVRKEFSVTLDPNTIAAIGGVITAVAALVTSVHAHGKATGAKAAADFSSGSARALERVLLDAVPQLVSALGVRLPAPQATTLSTLAPVVGRIGRAEDPNLAELRNWLAEQHKQQTGSYPHEGGPISDFSKVLAQIAMLELKQQ